MGGMPGVTTEVIAMPGGDRTGPVGMGPMTGRGVGYCAGYRVPGYANPMPGRGWGRGAGFGCGWGRGAGWRWADPYANAYGPGSSTQDEAEALKTQARAMQEEIDAVNARIKALESGAAQGRGE